MSELHEALQELAFINWEDVPQDNLDAFLTPIFTVGELLINSIPPAPSGTPFEQAEPHFQTPNTAKSLRDLYPSPARSSDPHDDHKSLQKQWGKPMKFGQKENPMGVALYKMAGKDRHGAWFARHNVLEGIGFSKFKRAMQREFPETLLTEGEPGAGAIRGLSAERRVERIDGSGAGRAEVYQLSAQMPSPVTPRDFLTLFLTTDSILTERSPSTTQNGETYIPRHFMVVSKSVEHPDAPQRSDYVRGYYESVELIREIPLHIANGTDPELNPVEWIMVTRSDPSGGLPRFLIDRGTPSAMLTDMTKFLNWACSYSEIPDADADLDKQVQSSEATKKDLVQETGAQPAESGDSAQDTGLASSDKASTEVKHDSPTQLDISNVAATRDGTNDSPSKSPEPVTAVEHQEPQGGMFSAVTAALEAGVESYAPASVSNYVRHQLHPEQDHEESSSDSDSTSSSYLSANEMRRLSSTKAQTSVQPEAVSTVGVAGARSASPSSQITHTDQRPLSRHDKEVLRITKQRESLDEKFSKKREAEEAKFKQSQEKEQSEQDKAKGKMDQELKKTEERHRREVEKLEAKRAKELRKAEERRKKKDDNSKLSLVARERDDIRTQADLLRKENALLVEQVEILQRENNALVDRLSQIAGPDSVKNVLDDHEQSAGLKSASHVSLAPSESSGKKGAAS